MCESSRRWPMPYADYDPADARKPVPMTISDDLVVYLFGTPGQKRFWFMWDELAYGALGAVVMADTRRLADCFPSIDYFERNGMPFVVAVNCFDEARRYPSETMRSALNLTDDVPLLLCDA